MKKFALVLALLAVFSVPAFATETVKAYTTMEEPLAKALFDA